MTVKSRLYAFIKFKGISIRNFEEVCGMSNGYISSMRKGLGEEKLNNVLTAFPELNRNWLLHGEGNMLKEDKVEEPMQSYTAVPSGDMFAYLREKDEEIRELRTRIDTLVAEKHELQMLIAHLEGEQSRRATTPHGDVAEDTMHTKVG